MTNLGLKARVVVARDRAEQALANLETRATTPAELQLPAPLMVKSLAAGRLLGEAEAAYTERMNALVDRL